MATNVPPPTSVNCPFESNSWHSIPTYGHVPVARHCHSSVLYKDALYIFGGYSSDNSRVGVHRNDLCKYDFATQTWTSLYCVGHDPAYRHSHTAVVYNDFMYIFGGISSAGETLNDIIRYHFDSSTWSLVAASGDPPAERWGHSATILHRKKETGEDDDAMVIFGGYGNNFMNDLWEFKFSTSTWHIIRGFGSFPKHRQFHSAAIYNNNLYIVGGFGNHTNMVDCQVFNFESHVWIKGATMVMPRRGHTSVIHKNTLYIFGGFDSRQMNDINTLDLDDPTAEWQVVDDFAGTPPSPRHFHTSVAYGSSMYTFGGFSRKLNLNDIWQYCFEDIPSKEVTDSISMDMKRLVNCSKYSDITFIVEGKEIFAHRNILFCRSEHFCAMIDNGMKESNLNRITISDAPYNIFLNIIEYIYTDKVTIQLEDAVETLILSDRYLLPGLKRIAERMLTRVVAVDNVVNLLEIATSYQASTLAAKCWDFVNKKKDNADLLKCLKEMKLEPQE